MEAGHRYDIEEGSEKLSAARFVPRREFPAGPVPAENSPVMADTWLVKPVPLPELTHGPGFVRLSSLSGERADWYAIFCRYLFDLRADLKLPVWFLVDGENRAHKIYFHPPPVEDLERLKDPDRLALALPTAGIYYTAPARNYEAVGAAFVTAGYAEKALQYLALAPQNNDRILFAIGKIHLHAAKWETARENFKNGLALAPHSADGWNSLGAVEVGAGNLAAALQNFEKALAINPEMSSALINAGQAQVALGNPESGEKLFRRALEIDPKDAVAANLMGELLHDGAWFERAIEWRRDYAPAINNLAAFYASKGKSSDAIAALRYGIQVAPEEESLYLNLAGLYVNLDNREAARSVIEQLLARRPQQCFGEADVA